MSLFQPPPRTRYDLNFTLAGFPVQVHPLFWLMTIMFGLGSGNVIELLIWIVVVFISILIHELGHSLMMRLYGQDSYIVLHIAGGLAVPTGRGYASLSTTQWILISLAGPFAGFLFAAIVIGIVMAAGGFFFVTQMFDLIPMPMAFLPSDNGLNTVIWTILWINIFWGFINLMPVFPLDGGQVARQLFIKFDPWNGVHNSLWLSTIAGAFVAVAGFVVLDSTYMAFLFGILAVQSYQQLQGGGSGVF